MCPGNHESAGKRKWARRPKGVVCGRYWWKQPGRPPQQGNLTAAQYKRLVKRMGKKKALVAVGHSILIIVYHVLQEAGALSRLGRGLL